MITFVWYCKACRCEHRATIANVKPVVKKAKTLEEVARAILTAMLDQDMSALEKVINKEGAIDARMPKM